MKTFRLITTVLLVLALGSVSFAEPVDVTGKVSLETFHDGERDWAAEGGEACSQVRRADWGPRKALQGVREEHTLCEDRGRGMDADRARRDSSF